MGLVTSGLYWEGLNDLLGGCLWCSLWCSLCPAFEALSELHRLSMLVTRGDHCRGVVVALFDTIYGERGKRSCLVFFRGMKFDQGILEHTSSSSKLSTKNCEKHANITEVWSTKGLSSLSVLYNHNLHPTTKRQCSDTVQIMCDSTNHRSHVVIWLNDDETQQKTQHL